MMFEDEIWDEEQWEAFLRQSDEIVRRYMDLLFAYLADDPPPDAADTEARRAWEQRLRRFLEEKGFEQDPALFHPFADDDADDPDAPDEAMPERPDGYRDIPVYRKAAALAGRVLDWTNRLPGDVKDSSLVQFCSAITQIPANIAKGHGIGYEREMIGGNIACAKRGLAAANSALEQLREMRPAPYMDEERYLQLYEQTFEVRNALGLYVQDLRARFNLGVD